MFDDIRRRVFFLGLTLLCLVVMWPLLTPVGIGAAAAYACEQPYFYLLQKLKIEKPRWQFLFSCFFVFPIYALFFVPLGILLYSAISELVSLIAENKDALTYSELSLMARELTGKLIAWAGLELDLNQVMARINKTTLEIVQNMMVKLGDGLTATPHFLFHTFTMLMVWVFFLKDGRAWREAFLPQVIPWSKERNVICVTTGEVIRGVIIANVLVSLVQAGILMIVFFSVGLPNALVWSLAGFFSSFIPAVGTLLVIGSAAAYSFFTAKTTAAVVILLSSAIVGTVDNLLRPMLMKGGSDLNFFWIFIAFVGGIEIFGTLGIVAGPIIFSLTVAFFRLLNPQTR